ncbi:unnamed protein product [Paramecium primaurelia]|uniref:HPt domain-containing protein n=1 Tax=Paramecium primaurelia TaxID=5886 RepID=A0A8S1LNY2_PARPR|nr:unnamed protein product [Paramecium primaurelia]
MSNHFPQESYDIFDVQTALEYLPDETMVKGAITLFLTYFQDGEGFDELINLYEKGGWQLVGTPAYLKFEQLAHSIKGSCRYLALHRLEKKLELLQFFIRDGKEIQVASILNEVLEQCPYAQRAVLKYMEMPDEKVRHYKFVSPFYDVYGNVHICHKLNYTFQKQKNKMSAIHHKQPYQQQIINCTDQDQCNIF